MTRRNRKALTRLLATTSLVALSLSVAPVVLAPPIGGAALSYADDGSSCFVAGTMVLMADGSERPIESLRPGDFVRGAGGRINRVVGIERPRLGGRRLYGFNGGEPFVTAEHPFLTMAGWKAIDPDATARENARLRVAPLKTGDLLMRGRAAPQARTGNLAEDSETAFWFERVTMIETAEAAAETTVYNLLLDGDHSYIADGYVVHNKGDDDGNDGGGNDGGGGGEHESGGSGGSGGGESGSSDSGGSGEGGEAATSGSESESENSGKGGSESFFSGDPGAADHDLSPAEEADLISRGWQ